jgi:glutamate carboxypeptidase
MLVTEPARDGGKIVTGRKGRRASRFSSRAFRAHAGSKPEDGRSAIRELGNVIQTLEALNDLARGISVNVGVVRGRHEAECDRGRSVCRGRPAGAEITDADEIVPKIFGLKSRTEGVK